MKTLRRTIAAILFGILLIEILVLTKAGTNLKLTFFGYIPIVVVAAILYYFIFEYKKK